ncbi:urease accessory protein UreD [Roseiterribacter gracilis]|uniref:Urease accessory protein UreD n=1 Tax=Roseiterribacter gracilis TaxID=2812848 RepID=A0A8S8X747_9PROT|nr:urease accessory protein UreD [Rhodospirillales bacterium TMPK1]
MRAVALDLPATPVRLQRADGAACLRFARRGPSSALADLYQRAPCRVLFPHPPAHEPPQAVLVTTTGGLTGGDRLRVDVAVDAGAAATVTTQAAEKLYRSAGGDAEIDISISVQRGGWAEWLMQETILFDGARLQRKTQIDVAEGARLLAVESLVFGRSAMGESFTRGTVFDSWRLRRDGKLRWADAQRFDAADTQLRFSYQGAAAAATLLYVGADAPSRLALVRDTLDGDGGATVMDELLLVRAIADDATSLRATVARLVAALRGAAGFAATVPRVWQC